ncbi:type III pantothenate kinase (pantothenic acid kinase) (pank-III) [Ralstonia solanacearum Po82]|uniref:Type III pantothenate kinase n=1 Tax=Ralstonia solanacearum (strain Po82) TaxID=1031711 RepID=F6G4C1_RALS8|nr:type III pantothenate kinase (pantothenic acid kinase) (pank-III) [Ralstonia solanacearum Po82]
MGLDRRRRRRAARRIRRHPPAACRRAATRPTRRTGGRLARLPRRHRRGTARGVDQRGRRPDAARRAVRPHARVFDGARVRIVASKAAAAGLRNGYRDPAQLGTDRWVGAVGARHAWPDTALLLVTAGTATTLDIVTPDGLFAGGLILPGLTLMMRALSRNTAQLPEIDIGYLAARDAQAQTIVPPWADNTQDAIALGCVTAQAGAIAQTWQALQARYPGPARCVLSGGARAALGPHLRMPFQMHDNLVLLGLQVLAQAGHEGRPGVATPA